MAGPLIHEIIRLCSLFLIKRNYFNIIRYVIYDISILNIDIPLFTYTSIVVVALLSLNT